MNIGIFAPWQSSQARRILAAAASLPGVQAHFFDMSLKEGPPVAISDSALRWNGVDLCGLSVAFLHGFSYMNPVVPSDPADGDYSVWRTDYLSDQQRYSFLFSLFTEMARRGVRMVNPPDVFLQYFMKPFSLESIAKAGFFVPETLCTNDADSVAAFCRRHEAIVWRPATGRAAWQPFREKQRRNLIRRDAPPLLLAESMDGPLVRCYLYDGKPLLFLKYDAPSGAPPERLERFWAADFPDLHDELRRFSESLDLSWAMVMFVVSGGKMWIYDVDPDPVLEWLPAEFRDHLVRRLAAELAGQSPPETGLVEEGHTRQRPAFFLRRMLRILFEIESIKYPRPNAENEEG